MPDFVLTETRAGARVHRDGCTRRGAGVPVQDATATAPGALAVAKSAGCCKPREADWRAVATPEPVDHTVAYTHMAKHFWPMARDCALAVADAAGVAATPDNAARTVTLHAAPDDVARVRLAVLGAWAAAPAALKEWKARELARHKTIPVDDRWREYYAFLRRFYSRYAEDIGA